MKPFLVFLCWLFGPILIGAGLVVQDEILTLVAYCGRACLYPYPFIGAFHFYDAEIIAFVMVLVGIALFSLGSVGNTARVVTLTIHYLVEQRNRKQSTDKPDDPTSEAV